MRSASRGLTSCRRVVRGRFYALSRPRLFAPFFSLLLFLLVVLSRLCFRFVFALFAFLFVVGLFGLPVCCGVRSFFAVVFLLFAIPSCSSPVCVVSSSRAFACCSACLSSVFVPVVFSAVATCLCVRLLWRSCRASVWSSLSLLLPLLLASSFFSFYWCRFSSSSLVCFQVCALVGVSLR